MRFQRAAGRWHSDYLPKLESNFVDTSWYGHAWTLPFSRSSPQGRQYSRKAERRRHWCHVPLCLPGVQSNERFWPYEIPECAVYCKSATRVSEAYGPTTLTNMKDIACGLLSWSQYSLLSSPRHILVSQYGLISPLISGLFYLSPAGGFLLGTLVGGRFSDHTVRKWIKLRDGVRLPQDRLRAGSISWFFVIPAASLIYGWCIEEHAGGLALPIVFAFWIAAGLLAAFAGLNTYCAGKS